MKVNLSIAAVLPSVRSFWSASAAAAAAGALGCLCPGAAPEASAGVTLHTDRAVFEAATSGRTQIGFEGIAAPGTAVAYPTSAGVTLSGVQFVGTKANGTVGELYVESATHLPGRNWGTGDFLIGDRFGLSTIPGLTPIGAITALLPAGTFAVGADYLAVFADGSRPAVPVRFTVVTLDGSRSDFDLNSAADAVAFAGFVSEFPIAKVEYRTMGVGAASPYGGLDNFVFGTVTAPRARSAMLEWHGAVRPAVSFRQIYNERMFRLPGIGWTSGADTMVRAKMVASLDRLDLSVLNASTPVGISIGRLYHQGTLGEGGWAPGKQRAVFPLRYDVGEPATGRVSYVWTERTLTIEVEDSGDIIFAPVPWTAHPDDGPSQGELAAWVRFGSGTGTRTIFYAGQRTTREVAHPDGSGEFEELSRFIIEGTSVTYGPQMAIQAPAAGSRTTQPEVELLVKSPATAVSAGVDLEAYASLTAGPEPGQWHGPVALVPGPNRILVQATDAEGGLTSAEVTVHYVVLATLKVNVVGSGGVSRGFLGESERELGQPYRIEAKPGRGQVFAGWTGGITSSEPGLKFTMQPGLELTANFIPSPFPALAGTYVAASTSTSLFDPTGFASGFTLAVTSSGQFTGKGSFFGKVIPFQGRLEIDGSGSVTLRSTEHGEVTFSFTLDPATGALSGMAQFHDAFGIDSRQVALRGNRNLWNRENPAPLDQQGAYTLLMTLSDDPSSPPLYGTMQVSDRGRVRLVFLDRRSAGSALGSDGAVRFHTRLVNGFDLPAMLTGELFLRTAVESDADGAMTLTEYVRMGGEFDVYQTHLSTTGSRFQVAPGQRVLTGLEATLGQAKLDFVSVESAFTQSLTANVAPTHKVSVAGLNAEKLEVTINPVNGIFRGRFHHPSVNGRADFWGIVFQRRDRALGTYSAYRVGPPPDREEFYDAGSVTLAPSP